MLLSRLLAVQLVLVMLRLLLLLLRNLLLPLLLRSLPKLRRLRGLSRHRVVGVEEELVLGKRLRLHLVGSLCSGGNWKGGLGFMIYEAGAV